MKEDRFLMGILVGIGVLVVAAFVLFFVRQSQVNYVADNTPAGVVQNYVLALHKGDYQKAYAYLAAGQYPANGQNKPTFEQFRNPFITNINNISTADIQIGETNLMDQDAVVNLVVSYPGGFYGGSSSSNPPTTAILKMENGQWKITQMPQPYWYYDWYQPQYLPPSSNSSWPTPTPTARPAPQSGSGLPPTPPPTPTAQ